MGNAQLSEIAKAQLTANTALNANLNKANEVLNGIHGQDINSIDELLSSAFDKLRSTNYDGVVGLEVGRVDDMINAIDRYIESIDNALSPLDGSSAKNAFGDQISSSIEEFVSKVKVACLAFTSNIQGFKDDLREIRKSMETKATNVNTATKSRSGELETTTSGWKYSGK